ncbi:MAG TPA: hypothetical protein VL119_01175 [Acidimicrobiia bacterium]|nr:hypothetical protein [Acidimicrobiia bacterium]
MLVLAISGRALVQAARRAGAEVVVADPELEALLLLPHAETAPAITSAATAARGRNLRIIRASNQSAV